MADISQYKIEKVRGDAKMTTVHGPYEPDYGRQHYGNVVSTDDGFSATAPDGRAEGGRRDLGTHRRLGDAVRAIAEYAEANLTAAALTAEFEPKTRGGHDVSFHRRAGNAVVVTFRDGKNRVMTAFGEDGIADIYRDAPKGSEDARKAEAMRLVRREPAPEAEIEDEPEAGPSPR